MMTTLSGKFYPIKIRCKIAGLYPSTPAMANVEFRPTKKLTEDFSRQSTSVLFSHTGTAWQTKTADILV